MRRTEHKIGELVIDFINNSDPKKEKGVIQSNIGVKQCSFKGNVFYSYNSKIAVKTSDNELSKCVLLIDVHYINHSSRTTMKHVCILDETFKQSSIRVIHGCFDIRDDFSFGMTLKYYIEDFIKRVKEASRCTKENSFYVKAYNIQKILDNLVTLEDYYSGKVKSVLNYNDLKENFKLEHYNPKDIRKMVQMVNDKTVEDKFIALYNNITKQPEPYESF